MEGSSNATSPQQRAAPPPTYDSVIGRVREVHKESSGTLDFIKKIILLVIGTVGYTIAISVTLVIPFAMMVVGVIYLSDCPINNNIPLYLLVGGVVGLLKQIFYTYSHFKKTHGRSSANEEEREETSSTMQTIFSCFMLCWLMLGSYWVYSEYKPNFDPTKGNYCNKTVYLLAFWQLNIIYTIFILSACCLCSVSLCVIACASRITSGDRESQPIHD